MLELTGLFSPCRADLVAVVSLVQMVSLVPRSAPFTARLPPCCAPGIPFLSPWSRPPPPAPVITLQTVAADSLHTGLHLDLPPATSAPQSTPLCPTGRSKKLAHGKEAQT